MDMLSVSSNFSFGDPSPIYKCEKNGWGKSGESTVTTTTHELMARPSQAPGTPACQRHRARAVLRVSDELSTKVRRAVIISRLFRFDCFLELDSHTVIKMYFASLCTCIVRARNVTG